jgi:hypothetical protein
MGMPRIASKDFVARRARFQRVSDAKIFHGWVRDFVGQSLVIATSTESAMRIGDCFLVEITGNGVLARLQAKLAAFGDIRMAESTEETLGGTQAKLVTVSTTDVEFRVVGQPAFVETNEQQRILAWGVTALIRRIGGASIEAKVVDLSLDGIGLTVREKFEKDEPVELDITTPYGQVTATAHVRYCRMPKNSFEYRLGLRFDDMGRLDRPRWTRLLEGAA